MVRLRGDETGSETVEFAIALPILIVACVAVAQLCIAGLLTVQLEADVNKACWGVDPAQLAAAADKDAVLSEAILSNSSLKEGDLSVSGVQVTTENDFETTALAPSAENQRLGITEMAHDRTLATVEADVTYRVPLVVPVADGEIEVTRHVRHTLVGSDRIEVR